MEISKNIEIERRWLLSEAREDSYRVLEMLSNLLVDCKKSEIKQWYISLNPVLRLRSHDDSEFVLCVKTKGQHTGMGTPEKESELSKEEFDNLMKFIKKNPVRKTRYYIPLENGFTAELDVFYDFILGLIIVEVEFPDEQSAISFIPPDWFGKNEITGKKAYSNAMFYSFMPDINK